MSNADEKQNLPQTNTSKVESAASTSSPILKVGMIVRVADHYIGIIAKIEDDGDIYVMNSEKIEIPVPSIPANRIQQLITTPYESDNSAAVIALGENRYYIREYDSSNNTFIIETGYTKFEIITILATPDEDDHKIIKYRRDDALIQSRNNEYYYVYPTQTHIGYLKSSIPTRPTNQGWNQESQIIITRGMIIEILPDLLVRDSFLGTVANNVNQRVTVVWIDKNGKLNEKIIPYSEVGFHIRSPYEQDINSSVIPIDIERTICVVRIRDIASNSFTIFLKEGVLKLNVADYSFQPKTSSSG